MLGIIPRLKRLLVEPRIYALILQSRRGAVLHLGVHYSLDEAIAAATPTVMAISPAKHGEKPLIDMYTSLGAGDVIRALIAPEALKPTDSSTVVAPEEKTLTAAVTKNSTDEQIRAIKNHKNRLMKDLIEGKNVEAVEASKGILSKAERSFIISKITTSPGGTDGVKQPEKKPETK